MLAWEGALQHYNSLFNCYADKFTSFSDGTLEKSYQSGLVRLYDYWIQSTYVSSDQISQLVNKAMPEPSNEQNQQSIK